MGFLDESAYLGDTPQTGMMLPQELADALSNNVAPAPTGAVPDGWVTLPGGIIIKKNTLVLLGVALLVFLAWWYTRKKTRK